MATSGKAESEIRFAKAQKRQQDASKALTEAEAENKRVDEKTARLKAARLARDAADALAAANAPPPAPKAKKKKPAAKKKA